MSEHFKRIAPELGRAREEFLTLIAEIRPELHRYCARLSGSVVEGEDLVQETLARAFYALSLATEMPPLRPWLFRIAHNTAIDFLRRYEHRHVTARADIGEVVHSEEPMDPAVLRAALASFLELPVLQRSAVILKDVLGHSLEETAETMATTVPAVKAALFRGRTTLRETRQRSTSEDLAMSTPGAQPGALSDRAERQRLHHYVELFNSRNWDGLRALMATECRLDLVSKGARRGTEVHGYFARYASNADAHLTVGSVEGRPALLYSERGELPPSYFILLQWEGERVALIRDFRYVPYITREASLVIDDPRAQP